MFTVKHFINKFEAIPEDKWNMYDYYDPTDKSIRCALGHCGQYSDNFRTVYTDESIALKKLLPNIIDINEGDVENFQQPTPKQRILAALNDIKRFYYI